MKKQLRKEDQNERVKILAGERAARERSVAELTQKYQSEIDRLEDLLAGARQVHDEAIEEVIFKHE